jgi:hypothetical protein
MKINETKQNPKPTWLVKGFAFHSIDSADRASGRLNKEMHAQKPLRPSSQ